MQNADRERSKPGNQEMAGEPNTMGSTGPVWKTTSESLPWHQDKAPDAHPVLENQRFRHWIVSTRIEERTLQHFWAFLDSYQKEHSNWCSQIADNFDMQFLEVTIENIDLRLENWPVCNTRYIVVHLSLRYKKNYYMKKGQKRLFKQGNEELVYVGNYTSRFHLSGEFDSEEFDDDVV